MTHQEQNWSNTGFGTRAVHAGQVPDPTTGAVMTPIYQTSTFAQASPGVIKDGYDYARSKNPTRTALEGNLASLEGGRHGLCFSSGCAATDCVIHLLSAGDHALLCDDVYGGTNRIFRRVYGQLGVEVTFVDMTDEAKVRAALRPNTKLLWAETPTNPTLKIVDIALMSKIARERGALLAVDNTFATPYLQNPLALGADMACHSSTKYIGGHSDVVGGAIIVNDDSLATRLRFVQNAVGAIPSPMDCFLLLRSTKTLHLRMQRHCSSAAEVARWLEQAGHGWRQGLLGIGMYGIGSGHGGPHASPIRRRHSHSARSRATTTQSSKVTSSDFTMKAATSTPGIPPSASPRAVRRWKRPAR